MNLFKYAFHLELRRYVGLSFPDSMLAFFANLAHQQKSLTQEQLAERSGFSQQYLSGLERGRRNPIIVTLYELAQTLGVSHLELVKPDRKH